MDLAEWKSSVELSTFLDANPDVSRIEQLWQLSFLAREARYPSDYRASIEMANAIVLSDAGRNALELWREAPHPNDLKLAIFGYFAHRDLLIDVNNTDTTLLKSLFAQDVLSCRITWPYRYGRTLYDRFNDGLARELNRTEHLTHEQANVLLKDTPQGVYQLGTTIVGPLGALESAESRYLPPSQRVSLWHCSDTGCQEAHSVGLMPDPELPLVIAFREISRRLLDGKGPASEWHHAMRSRQVKDRPNVRRRFIDLPVLLADAFSPEETCVLLEALLQGPSGGTIRSQLNSAPRKKTFATGNAADVAKRLTPEGRVQALMLASDRELVEIIDNLVISSRIRVPSSEVRLAKSVPPALTSHDTYSAVSCLGARSKPQYPIASLVELIVSAYEAAGQLGDLEWKLGSSGLSPRQALSAHLRQNSPLETVRSLILGARPTCEFVADRLWIAPSFLKSARLAELICWKVGLDLPRFDDALTRFKTHLDRFNSVLLKVDVVQNEDDREEIRAAGVNLFVALESFIETLVSYTIWLLASDHFGETRFTYTLGAARRAVSRVLGATRDAGGFEVRWLDDGKNTLGPMLVYLRAACDWVSELARQPRESLARPTEDFPHFAISDDRPFPFRHTALWADASPEALTRFSQSLSTVAQSLTSARADEVRNGLDHMRQPAEFPTIELMLSCVARLRDALQRADVHKLVPKSYWLVRRTSSVTGDIEYEFADYAGQRTVSFGPSGVSGRLVPSFGRPVIIAPVDFLPHSNSTLLFGIREPSPFSMIWAGYPRRRRIPPAHPKKSPETVELGSKDPTAPEMTDGTLEPTQAKALA